MKKIKEVVLVNLAQAYCRAYMLYMKYIKPSDETIKTADFNGDL